MGLYGWGTGYAGIKIRIPGESEDASTSSKGHTLQYHRYVLASKPFPASLQEVLESVIKMVNDVKTQTLNTRLFKELGKDMNADHEVILFYTAVRWLLKGNGINRVFEMKDEIKLLLEIQESD